jgi:hypothetical protein
MVNYLHLPARALSYVGQPLNGTIPSATVIVPTDDADLLRKFADLRDAGIITEEEFAVKKSKLLE